MEASTQKSRSIDFIKKSFLKCAREAEATLRQILKDNGGFIDCRPMNLDPMYAYVYSPVDNDVHETAIIAMRLVSDEVQLLACGPVGLQGAEGKGPEYLKTFRDEVWLPFSMDSDTVNMHSTANSIFLNIEEYVPKSASKIKSVPYHGCDAWILTSDKDGKTLLVSGCPEDEARQIRQLHFLDRCGDFNSHIIYCDDEELRNQDF